MFVIAKAVNMCFLYQVYSYSKFMATFTATV